MRGWNHKSTYLWFVLYSLSGSVLFIKWQIRITVKSWINRTHFTRRLFPLKNWIIKQSLAAIQLRYEGLDIILWHSFFFSRKLFGFKIATYILGKGVKRFLGGNWILNFLVLAIFHDESYEIYKFINFANLRSIKLSFLVKGNKSFFCDDTISIWVTIINHLPNLCWSNFFL